MGWRTCPSSSRTSAGSCTSRTRSSAWRATTSPSWTWPRRRQPREGSCFHPLAVVLSEGETCRGGLHSLSLLCSVRCAARPLTVFRPFPGGTFSMLFSIFRRAREHAFLSRRRLSTRQLGGGGWGGGGGAKKKKKKKKKKS